MRLLINCSLGPTFVSHKYMISPTNECVNTLFKNFSIFSEVFNIPTFSDRLKELRKKRNLTQKTLAEAIGMSETGIQNYELKTRKPNLDALTALADYFDCNVDYLIGRSDDPTRH